MKHSQWHWVIDIEFEALLKNINRLLEYNRMQVVVSH